MRRYRHFHRKEKKQPSSRAIFIIREIAVTVAEVAIAILAAYFLIDHAILKSPVASDAMNPTLKRGTVVLINKLAYKLSAPKREDVIVYKQAGREHSYLEFSRVIGLPGETVKITGVTVYINSNPMPEKINVARIKNSGLAEDGVKLGTNEFFVLGDNRNNSEDSRFANVGNIIKSDIIGKAWATEKPFSIVSGRNLIADNKKDSAGSSGSSLAKE